MVKLRHDPLQIFKASKTPAGLYARQKWLGETGTREWRDDYRETVCLLMDGQSDDGSWNQSPLEGIRRLFGLHLTVRNVTGEIEMGLNWLVKYTLNESAWNPAGSQKPLSPDAFRGLPFSPGKPSLSLACATLFLAAIFQKLDAAVVVTHYRLLARWVADHAGGTDTWSVKDNALRALVVHPDYAEGIATGALVDRLGEIQDPVGYWPEDIPIFRTVNALAHLRLERAHRQCVKALQFLCGTQNGDGSWGKADLEWNTFLVVHALKNKACL
jgi:hypothetical protein